MGEESIQGFHLQADRHHNKDGDLFITIKDCGSAQDPAGWDSAIDRSDVFAPPQWSVGSHDYDCSNADSTWWYDLGYYSTLPLGRPRVEGQQTRRDILLGRSGPKSLEAPVSTSYVELKIRSKNDNDDAILLCQFLKAGGGLSGLSMMDQYNGGLDLGQASQAECMEGTDPHGTLAWTLHA